MNQTELKNLLPGFKSSSTSLDTFFMNQAHGFNGLCSDTVGVGFMQDIMHDNTCSQIITDLSMASKTTLTPKSYYSYDDPTLQVGWGIAPGIGESTSRTVAVNLGQVWV